MAIKKAVILVLNNKTTGSVISSGSIRKSTILSDEKLTSAVTQSSAIRKGIVTPSRITSQILPGKLQFVFNFSEEVISSDIFNRIVGYVRSIEDLVDSVDIISFNINKSAEDSYILADPLSLSFTKIASDSFSQSDVRIVDFDKRVSDLVQAIDALRFNVAKSITDNNEIEQIIAKSLAKALSDLTISQDIISLVMGKTITESVNFTDSIKFSFDLGKRDTNNLSERTSFSVNKPLVNQVAITDIFNKVATYIRSFQDASLSNDNVIKQIDKIFSDDIASADLINLLLIVNRFVSETVTIDDTAAKTTTKNLSELNALIDQISKLINKSISDQVTLASSGSLISQGYTEDNTYFLEDYVGESRTFT